MNHLHAAKANAWFKTRLSCGRKRRIMAMGLGLGLLGMSGLNPWAWAGEGTTGAEFLHLWPAARSAALAGCYSALGHDAEILFFNPAGIMQLLNPQVGLSHLAWWEGVSYDAIWGVQPLDTWGALGITGTFLNVQPFNSTEDPSNPSEQAWSSMVGVSGAFKLWRNVRLGIQVKNLFSALGEETAWGLAADLGAQYYSLNDQLVFAAVIRNLGFMTAFLETQDPLPMQARLGVAYHFWPDDPQRFSVGGEVNLPWEGGITGAVGVEGWFWNLLALRCGVQAPVDAGQWLTVGAGAHWQRLHVDYAVSPLDDLGMTHRLTLSYDFGSQRRLARPRLDVTMLTKQFVHPDGEAGYEIKFIPKAEIPAGLGRWDVVIRDRSHKQVRQFQGQDQLPMTVVWNGADGDGKRVDVEGYYTYLFSVVDHLGYSAQVGGEILPVSITKLPKLKAAPRDIFAGQVRFAPRTVDNMKAWSITIVSNDGRALKKYQGQGNIPKDMAWDGTDTSNRPVAVKKGFRFVLKTMDQTGNEVVSTSPIVVVDPGTKAFYSSVSPVAEQVPFRFKFSGEANINSWSLDILANDTKQVVRTCEATGPMPEVLYWDTCDEQGKPVAAQRKYSYVLRLQDAVGNVWQQASDIPATPIKILPSPPNEMRVKIEQILFDFNQAELKPDMDDKLNKIANLAKMHPSRDVKIYIEGHTDDVGSAEYNLELSVKRAKMVMRYLVEEQGLSSAMIEFKGYGKTQPLLSDDSPDARSQNRRVEVTLVLPR